MKLANRFFATLSAAALIGSLLSLPALAAETGEESIDLPVTLELSTEAPVPEDALTQLPAGPQDPEGALDEGFTVTTVDEDGEEPPAEEEPPVEEPARWESTNVIGFGALSDGITFDVEYTDRSTHEKFTFEQLKAMSDAELSKLKLLVTCITLTIPAGYEAMSVNVAFGDIFMAALNYAAAMPGEYQACQLKIENLSGHSYAYTDGSLAFSTEDYTPYFQGGQATPTDTVAFDGQNVPAEYAAQRAATQALADLLGKKGSSYLKTEDLSDENIGQALVGAGYENGVADLNLYYLKWMNDKYATTHTKLESFSDRELNSIFGGNARYVKETANTELLELGYNFFYNHMFRLLPAGTKDVSTDTFTLGQLMRDYNANGVLPAFEEGVKAAFGAIPAYAEENESGNVYTWNGFTVSYSTDIANGYQDYNLGFTGGLTLARTDKPVEPPVEPPVDPTPDPGPSYDYYRVTVQYREEGSNKTLHSDYRTQNIREGRSYDVSAPAALEIAGYTISSVDGAVTGTLNSDLTITVYYVENEKPGSGGNEPEAPGTTDPGTPGDEEIVIPDEETPLGDLPVQPPVGGGEDIVIVDPEIPMGDLPQTGTTSNASLGLSAALLSLSAAAGVLALTLKRRDA